MAKQSSGGAAASSQPETGLAVTMTGEELRTYREQRHMPQSDFATSLNQQLNRRYTASQISRWETNAERVPPAVVMLLRTPERTAQSVRQVAAAAPVVITVANQKGGVAKTTTSINLAYALASRGHRTLLVDLDPQADATMHVGLDVNDLHRRGLTIENTLLGKAKLADIIQPLDIGVPLFVVGSSIVLSNADIELSREPGSDRVLAQAIGSIRGEFAAVVIDCPPQLSLITLNGLAAADYVLIPTQAEVLSVIGIDKLLETIEKVALRTNPSLVVLGILPTMVGRTKQDKQTLADLHDSYSGRFTVFREIIRTKSYSEAAADGRITLEALPKALGIDAYEELADAVEKLIPKKEGPRHGG